MNNVIIGVIIIVVALALLTLDYFYSDIPVINFDSFRTTKKVIWTRMGPPTDDVLGQEFEYEGRMVRVIDYNPEGIATLTIEYL